MDDVEAGGLLFDVSDNTDSADVTSSSDHGDAADLELEEVVDLVSLKVKLDCVIKADLRMSIPDGAAVVCDDVSDLLVTNEPLVNAAKLEFGLLWLDLVGAVTALAVVDKAELLVGLAEFDDIHETGWVAWVGPDLAVDLDKAALADGGHLTSVEGVL